MVNGVPQNDPEDFSVYWIDFPDLLAAPATFKCSAAQAVHLLVLRQSGVFWPDHPLPEAQRDWAGVI